MNARRVRELITTAQGRKKAEVVIENIQLVNVYSREIHPSFSVGLPGPHRLSGTRPRPSYRAQNTGSERAGEYLLPGFIDAHTHLDSIFTCGAYSPYALATGNTTAITKMAMIANVLEKREWTGSWKRPAANPCGCSF